MNYIAAYTHILVSKDDCEPQWILNLIYGTKEGHGVRTMSGEFITYSSINVPTVIKKDVCSYEWEEEIIPYNTLEEALEDIHKKEAYYDIHDIGYMYSGDYFGLTEKEQEKVMDFLFSEYETKSTIEPTSEWIELPDDIDNELPF